MYDSFSSEKILDVKLNVMDFFIFFVKIMTCRKYFSKDLKNVRFPGLNLLFTGDLGNYKLIKLELLMEVVSPCLIYLWVSNKYCCLLKRFPNLWFLRHHSKTLTINDGNERVLQGVFDQKELFKII